MSLETAAVTIRGLLFADVFADLLQLKAHCGHCVSTGPEVLAREIPLFATQAGSSLWRSSLLEIRSRRPPDTSEGSRCTCAHGPAAGVPQDRKSTRLNSSHMSISYAVFCLKKKKK